MTSGSDPIRRDKITINGGVSTTGQPNPVQYDVEVFDPSGLDNSNIFNGSIAGGDQGMRLPQETHSPKNIPDPKPPGK
jgi:hypothetical protein